MIVAELQKTKIRRWLNADIHLVYLFRLLYEQMKKTKDSSEKNRINRKIKHLQKKIKELARAGEVLGLTANQIREVNLKISEKAKQGDNPKKILQAFLPKKRKKSRKAKKKKTDHHLLNSFFGPIV